MTQQEFMSHIEQHRDYVTGFIYNLTKRHADKDDIISESILLAWRFRNRAVASKFRSWWSKIARNCMMLFYRKSKKSLIDLRDNRSYVYHNQFLDNIPVESDRVRKLKLVLECLPLRQREVFVAYKGNERSSYKNSDYSSTLANEYSVAAIKNIKQLWKVFDISPNIQKIELLTTTQVGEQLGVCGDTVLNMIRRGSIDAIRVGATYKIDKSWVDAYLTKQNSVV